MNRKHLIWLIPLAVGLMFVIALYIPNSLPVNSDFGAIYYTDLGLVHGVHIYDLPAAGAFAARSLGIAPEKFFLPRFPYPPWYALSTFYLGLMPMKPAATLWFELNLVMLFISVRLLTAEWSPRMKLISFLLGLCFLPVLGTLSVGQYDFPVLLGMALLVHSLRKENVFYITLAAILLTFKPHVGGLVLLSMLLYLFLRKDDFGRRALRSILWAGAGLFILGFLADPGWPISYPAMLLGYQNQGNVSSCSECANWPIWLSRWFFDGSLASAARIAMALLVMLVLCFSTVHRALAKSAILLVLSALLTTLLASPYLYNYDYLLLLVPLALLFRKDEPLPGKITIFLCYLSPTIAIAVWGRAGNLSLLIVTLVLAAIHYMHAYELSMVVEASNP